MGIYVLRPMVEGRRYDLVFDVEHRLYRPVLAGVRAWGRAGPRLANGSVHLYLGYGFVVVCGALILLVATR